MDLQLFTEILRTTGSITYRTVIFDLIIFEYIDFSQDSVRFSLSIRRGGFILLHINKYDISFQDAYALYRVVMLLSTK